MSDHSLAMNTYKPIYKSAHINGILDTSYCVVDVIRYLMLHATLIEIAKQKDTCEH